jgi:hypothetical protein
MKPYCKTTVFQRALLPGAAAVALFGIQNLSAADYPTTVLADKPIAYYRLEETSGDVAVDSSASGQYPGYYTFSLPDGIYPIQGQPGIDTNCIELSAADPSSVSIGYYAGLNQPGPFSFEIWARPASLSGNNYRCPIGNFSGWAVSAVSGWYVYQLPGNQWAFITTSGVWLNNASITPLTWYHLVGTYDGTNAAFYVNGVLIGTEAAGAYTPNNNTASALQLGERGDGNEPFDGELDEAAIYTNALTAAQVLTHYQVGTNSFRAAPTPPTILADLSSTTAWAGHSVTFSVTADGTAPLGYEWFNGTSRISGATGNSYTFTCAPTDDQSTYFVIVTNSVGSITSSVATLFVDTGVQVDGALTPITRNVGSAAAFEIAAEGALPLSYQWYQGSSTLIPGATNPVLWLTNVQASASGTSYYVSIINPYTSINSDPATLTVQSRAVTVPITRYAKVVVADGPVAYWRLDEPSGSTNAVDAVGSFDGAYTNISGTGAFTFDAATGVPHETDGALGIVGGAAVSVPYAIEINPTTAFTVEGWFQPASTSAGNGGDYRTALSSMSDPWGAGPTGWLVYQTDGNNWSWWPYNGYWNGVQLTDTDPIVAGLWYYLAMTYDGTTLTFYVNGVAKTSGTDSGFVQNGDVPTGSQDYNYNYNQNHDVSASGPLTLGWRGDKGFNPFSGAIDEVAVYNKALTAQQVQNHYMNSTHLSVVTSGKNLTITWPTGTLQASGNVSGPYTNVIGATSPFTASMSGKQLFYRAQLQ